MANYNWESLRKVLNDTWTAAIVSEADKEYDSTQFTGDYLFPRVGWDKDTVERGREDMYDYPAEYVPLNDSSPMMNNRDNIVRESLTLAQKSLKDQLPIDKIVWVLQADTISAKQWAMLKQDTGKILVKLNRSIILRNEIEVWNYLTYGTMWTMDGVQYYNLKPYGLDQTDLATGICFHTRENWIALGGTINASATIQGDVLEAITAMNSGWYDTATTMWMNSTTYACLYGNTVLNTQVLDMYNPLYTKGFLGYDIDWSSKGIQTSSLKPHGKTIAINDGKYRSRVSGSAQVKFIPDYYVVYAPSRVGTRYVAPNRYNGSSDKWSRSWTSNSEINGLFFEVGEYSLPFADNLEWKSHYVQYVKHTS